MLPELTELVQQPWKTRNVCAERSFIIEVYKSLLGLSPKGHILRFLEFAGQKPVKGIM